MKKIAVIFFLLLAFTLSAEEKSKHFSAGIHFITAVGQNSVSPSAKANVPGYDTELLNVYKYNEYNGVGIEFAYRLPLFSIFQIQPSANLAYTRHGRMNFYKMFPYDGAPPQTGTPDGKYHEFSFGICLPVGVRIPIKKTSLEVGTGPLLGAYIYQEGWQTQGWNPDIEVRTNYYNVTRRFRAFWRFYCKYNFLNDYLYAKVSFDIGMNHYLKSQYEQPAIRQRNQLTFGIGVNF